MLLASCTTTILQHPPGIKKLIRILVFVYCFLGSHSFPFLLNFWETGWRTGTAIRSSQRVLLDNILWHIDMVMKSEAFTGRSFHHPTCSSSLRAKVSLIMSKLTL